MNYKIIIFITAILFCTNPPMHAQSVNNPGLRKELLERLESDQRVRREMPDEPDKIKPEHINRLQEIDRENTARMKQIIERHGFPGKSLVCEDGAYAAFILVQHADLEPGFQKSVLPLLDKAVRAGEALGIHFAYLTDRIRIGENKPQIYGSQLTYRDGGLVPLPIEDEASVDRRRAEFNLPTMAEYIKGQKSLLTMPPCSLNQFQDEDAAIKRTVLDYAEGWYEGDAERMKRSLHPNLAKRNLAGDPNKAEKLENMTADALIELTAKGYGKSTPPTVRQKDITILDRMENAATVKLVMRDWIDYMHLVKFQGQWLIVNVLWEMKPKKTATSATFDKRRIFELVNVQRVSNKLRPLLLDKQLSKVAQTYSQKMARKGFYSHTESNGATVENRVKKAGIFDWQRVGENLFYCGDGCENSLIVNGWMNSVAHKKNILDKEWTATGIGVAVSEKGEQFITQIFTSPKLFFR